jgi:hypothetical protein
MVADTPRISYRFESEPSGATIYAVPLLEWQQVIAKGGWTEESLWEYRRGTTAADLDMFDQKYVIILYLKSDPRISVVDIIRNSTNRVFHFVFR